MLIDPSRCRGVAIALGGTLIAAMALGLGCHAALRPWEDWLYRRDQTFTVPPTFGGGARILGLRRERAGEPGRERLGVMIGASTLRQGIVPSLLDAEFAGAYRWSNLETPGNVPEIARTVRALYGSGLRPDALVLVISPAYLVAAADLQARRVWYDPKILRDHLADRQVEMARNDLVELTKVPLNLLFPYRGHVSATASRALFDAKVRMLASLGHGLDALAAPDPDPWADAPSWRESTAASELARSEILKFIGRKGYCDLSLYRTDGPNFAMLVEIFRLAHAHGSEAFIIFVPESSPYRAKLPPPAASAYPFTHTLRDALGPAAPVILDFRDAEPDDHFRDPNHLNPDGMETFSHRVAEALKPYLVAPREGRRGAGRNPGPGRAMAEG